MAQLYQRGDVAAKTRILADLSAIVKKAFEGEGAEIYENLQRLHSDGEMSVNDPAFSFPFRRCASNLNDSVEVSVSTHGVRESSNRVLYFEVDLKGADWRVKASLAAEAAPEASNWVFLEPPIGACTDAQVALPALRVFAGDLPTFTSCP